MLNSPTTQKLREMGLAAMATLFEKQLTDHNLSALPFEERFGLLIDAEWAERRNRKLQRKPCGFGAF